MPLAEFLRIVSDREGVTPAEARDHARAVLATLREAITAKEWSDVAAQLPEEYAPIRATARLIGGGIGLRPIVFRYLTLVLAAGLACTAPAAVSAGSQARGRAVATRTSGAYTAAGSVVVVQAAGNIRPAVNRYRNLLGPDNGGAPNGNPQGHREINWDSVPDQFAEPNALPGEFFNAATAPLARGAVLTTPGNHVAVSARANNPSGIAPRFGDINPSYPSRFQAFSPERLFSPIGSNVLNLLFRVPGTHKRAVVRGFGAVYTDVDLPEKTGFRYYDVHGRLLGAFTVPAKPRGLSFLGVRFPRAVVARVRIEYGNHALGPNDSPSVDVAVMDNFIYGEPRPASG